MQQYGIEIYDKQLPPARSRDSTSISKSSSDK